MGFMQESFRVSRSGSCCLCLFKRVTGQPKQLAGSPFLSCRSLYSIRPYIYFYPTHLSFQVGFPGPKAGRCQAKHPVCMLNSGRYSLDSTHFIRCRTSCIRCRTGCIRCRLYC